MRSSYQAAGRKMPAMDPYDAGAIALSLKNVTMVRENKGTSKNLPFDVGCGTRGLYNGGFSYVARAILILSILAIEKIRIALL